MLRVIVGLGNIRHALIQSPLDHALGSTSLRVGRCEPEFEGVMFEVIADSMGHLDDQLIPTDISDAAYNVICHLFAQHEVKVLDPTRIVLVPGFELYQYPILQEIVELGNGRI